MVIGQLSIANHDALTLFDSGASHSFASCVFAKKLGHGKDMIDQTFRTTLPSREILLSDFWLRHVPIIIVGREFYVDLVILEIVDYNVILGMDFLGKYHTTIDCQRRRVTFLPKGVEAFEYVDVSQKSQK